jgi:mannitol PTS system EIIA component
MTTILSREKIQIHAQPANKFDAIRLVGQMLVDDGHVPPEYIDYMIQREEDLSTYMGAGLAIPHGTNEAKKLVRSTGLAIAVVPEGVEFGDGQRAQLIVGIAAVGDDHLDILTNIAMLVSDEEVLERLLQTASKDEVLDIFQKGVEA